MEILLSEIETINVLMKISNVIKEEKVDFLTYEDNEVEIRRLQGIVMGMDNYWAIIKDIRASIGEVI